MRRLVLIAVALPLLAFLIAACGEEKIVEVEKIVTVEVEKEVEKIVEVEKVVEKEVEVEKILVATPTPPPAGQPVSGGDLRVILQASISALDPVFSFFAVVGSVASHFYENLFGWDANLEPQPRGVESWSTSSDGLTTTFTLREGMLFHNDTAFEAGDAVASIDRWLQSGAPATSLTRRFTDSVDVVDSSTFTWSMTEPFGPLLAVLAVPHPIMPMMPEEVAGTTPFSVAVEDRTGTAVYKFGTWRVGNRIVLERFDDYVSRSEPSSPGAYSGENIAYHDRIIFLEIPDEETKIAGLETGEWEVVDNAGFDFFTRLTDNPDIVVPLYKPGKRSNMYLNPQIPPFSDKLARQAIQTAINVEDFMFALGDPALWITCPAVYWCGTPLETDAGASFDVETSQGTRTIGYNVNDMETAKILLGDSDYAGETTVILNPTDYGTITPIGHVAQPVFEELGLNVEMPALDWATITTMFGNTGTWSSASDWYEHYAVGNPITDHQIGGTIDFIIKDEELINLQLAYARESDPAEASKIVDQLNAARLEKVTSLLLGQWFPISPTTVNLKNFEVKAVNYYVNTWLER